MAADSMRLWNGGMEGPAALRSSRRSLVVKYSSSATNQTQARPGVRWGDSARGLYCSFLPSRPRTFASLCNWQRTMGNAFQQVVTIQGGAVMTMVDGSVMVCVPTTSMTGDPRRHKSQIPGRLASGYKWRQPTRYLRCAWYE